MDNSRCLFFVLCWWAWSSWVGCRGWAVPASPLLLLPLLWPALLEVLIIHPLWVITTEYTHDFIWSAWIWSLKVVSKKINKFKKFQGSFLFWKSLLFYVHYIVKANSSSSLVITTDVTSSRFDLGSVVLFLSFLEK